VRLIDESGQQLGIVDTREALRIAQEKGLDLVLVSPAAKPPVARILDYGKWRYEQQQQEKERRKKQKKQDKKILDRVAEDLKEIATVEMPPQLAGRDMNMVLAPIAKK